MERIIEMTRIILNRMQRRATISAAMIRIHIQDTQTTGSIGKHTVDFHKSSS